MLSEIQKNKFTERAKEEIKKILNTLKIEIVNEDNICELQAELDLLVSSLVSAHEDGESIDKELLDSYDLLVDIVLDNEDHLDFLNQLFLN